MKMKKKVIPYCYKRHEYKNIYSSLSEMLRTGSYRKTITDLRKNNRVLTMTLQKYIIEAASQSNLLKEYTGVSSQILYARIKLNEMAKNLSAFATDLEKVRECLNVDLPSGCNFFQKKFCDEKLVKPPDVSCIEEESELSENENVTQNESPGDIFLSDLEDNVDCDIEMTPVSSVEDTQEIQKKKSESLSPQPNFDISYGKQKRSTRSKRKTSSRGKQSSISAVTHINANSPPVTRQVQDLKKEAIVSSRSSDVEVIKTEKLKIPFENDSYQSVNTDFNDSSVIQTSDCAINNKKSIVSNTYLDLPELNEEISSLQSQDNENHSSFTADFKNSPELNKEISPLQTQTNENSSSFAADIKESSNSHKSVQDESETCMNEEIHLENNSESDFSHISQKASFSLQDMQLPEVDEEIKSVASLTFCESDNDGDNAEQKNTTSHRIRSSRSKTPTKYSDHYFLSDESDLDLLGNVALAVTKRSNTKGKKTNFSPNRKSLVSNTDLNQSELKEKTSPLQSQNSENSSSFTTDLLANSGVHSSVLEESGHCVNNELKSNSEKSTYISQNVSSLLNDMQLPEIDEEIQSVASLTFCDSGDDDDSTEQKSILFSQSRSSHIKNLVEVESDLDLTFSVAAIKRRNAKSRKSVYTPNKKSNASNVELNKETSSLQSHNIENNLSFIADLEENSDIYYNVQEKIQNCVNNELSPKNNSEKLTDISQNMLPEVNEEIQNVTEQINTAAFQIRSSRTTKPVTFSTYFLSDDSDSDSTCGKATTKKGSNKRTKSGSTRNKKSHESTPTENTDKISSDTEKKAAEADYSVYNLDVSNSKKKGKKHKKKSSLVKSKSKKVSVVPKPLFQKCTVMKLKGGNFKFSKFETTTGTKDSEKAFQNSCVSPCGILKKSQSIRIPTSEDKAVEASMNEIENIDSVENNKRQSMLQTPKRVSFAPIDLVCNFKKTSESKAVARNRIVRRTSKSAFDFEKLLDEADQINTSLTITDSSSERTDTQKLNNSDISADTGMCTLTLPTQFPSSPANDIASLKPSFVASEETMTIIDVNDKNVEKSSNETVNSDELALKEKDIAYEISAPQQSPASTTTNINTLLPQHLSEMSESINQSIRECKVKLTDFILESPGSLVKSPQRKSLFKELPEDGLKENINLDNAVLEKGDSLEHIKEKSSLSIPSDSKKDSLVLKSQNKSHLKTHKISNSKIKSLNLSLVLSEATDAIDSTEESRRRRHTKGISYKEPSLIKKLRRN